MVEKFSKFEIFEACEQCLKANVLRPNCIKGKVYRSGGKIEPPECMKQFLLNLNTNNQPQYQPLSEETTKTTSPDECSPATDSGEKPTDSGKILSYNEHSANKNEHSKEQKCSFSGTPLIPSELKLTRTETEYLQLLSRGITNSKRIASMRKCSMRIVQRTLKNLRKKGAINRLNEIVRLVGGYSEHFANNQTVQPREFNPMQPTTEGSAGKEKHQIRLHGQQLLVGILEKDEKYKEKINVSMDILGNDVLCRQNAIEIYSNTSFFDDDVQKITAQSLEYWRRIIAIAENDLKIMLLKPRAQNIKLVKGGEYAEVGNELATKCELNGEKIRIYSLTDGKLWFLIDASFRIPEAETVHPQTAKEDMGNVIGPFFNDLRDKKPPLPSEIWNTVVEQAEYVKELGAGLNVLVNLHLKESQQKHENQALKEKDKSESSMEDVMFQ